MSILADPQTKLNLPIPYETKIKNTFNYFASKEEIVTKYIGYDAIISLFYLYLLKKYKSSCVLYDTTKKDTIVDIALGLTIHNTFGVNEEKKRELMEINRLNCNRIAKQIISCLKHRSKNNVIVLPITLIDYSPEGIKDIYTHNNLLLIRFGTNEIEHYEPHGAMAQILPTIEARNEAYVTLNQIINDNLVRTLNSLKQEHDTPDFRLIPTRETCPEEEGLQMLEAYSRLPKKVMDGAYCAIWTLFVAELALRNHNLTAREIIRIVNYDILQFDKKVKRPIRKLNVLGQKMSASDYLRKIARGYVNYVNEKLTKYFNDIFGQSMGVEDITEIGETNVELFDNIIYRVDGAIFVENIESVQGKKTDQQLLASLEKEMRKIAAHVENPLENSRLYKRYYYSAEYVRNRSGLDRISPASIFTPTPTSRSRSRSASKTSRDRLSSSRKVSSREYVRQTRTRSPLKLKRTVRQIIRTRTRTRGTRKISSDNVSSSSHKTSSMKSRNSSKSQ